MKVALYTRVSTKEQELDNQIRELEAVAQKEGWEIVATFSDEISGYKGRDKRPGYDALCKAVEAGEIDMVAAWSVDRLGRSLENLVQFMSMLHDKEVNMYLHQQRINTSTPAGKALFQMMGVFAEFEREMIRERVKAGIARAKEEGTKFGAPVKWSDEQRQAVRTLKDKGKTAREICRITGMGLGTVGRILASA